MAYEAAFKEIKRHLEKCKRALSGLREAKTADQLRDAWESYLDEFAQTIGKMISLGMKDCDSKSWAHRLKNASNGDDPGMHFLREARNYKTHGLTPVANFNDPHVNVAGLFSIGGNTENISFYGNIINGRPMGDFTLSTMGGHITQYKGAPNCVIEQIPAEINFYQSTMKRKRK